MDISLTDDVRDLYERSASDYEKMMDQEIGFPVYDFVLRDLASRLETVNGAIVDSSCGPGHMLERILHETTSNREIIGVDISPSMIAKARRRLGDSTTLIEGDMGRLPQLPEGSCAAVISFYAIHHLDADRLRQSLLEWRRVLTPGGHLLLAAWEGQGPIDYGDASDVVARRYRLSEIVECMVSVGLRVERQSVQAVEDFDMDTVHLLATNPIV